ncbi:MAG: hypothetical protein WCR05_07575 [Sphaerochaetaceae bacterium]|jgi:hypothetical protein
MKTRYTSGIAFICEGETEQIFYERLIYHFHALNQEYSYQNNLFDDKDNDYYSVATSDSQSVLIKMKTIGTVTQMTHAAQWFNNICRGKQQGLRWTVFLCYDTDTYQEDISKFYEEDWKILRKKLSGRNIDIIDLSASAMIEDLFLYDRQGICNFLQIPEQDIPYVGNGKNTLKHFFRQHGQTYHEGERARNLIWSLDIELISQQAQIQLSKVGDLCFPYAKKRNMDI